MSKNINADIDELGKILQGLEDSRAFYKSELKKLMKVLRETDADIIVHTDKLLKLLRER